jgi:hypothetical protein
MDAIAMLTLGASVLTKAFGLTVAVDGVASPILARLPHNRRSDDLGPGGFIPVLETTLAVELSVAAAANWTPAIGQRVRVDGRLYLIGAIVSTPSMHVLTLEAASGP